MPADGTALIKRYQRLLDDAANHFELADRMAPFVAPSRVGVLSERSPGEKQTTGVTDSTTMMAAELMAQFVAGNIINPAQRWASTRMRDPLLQAQDEWQEWQEECRDRQLRAFADSLFYAEGTETLIDWGGFGTGFLLTEEAEPTANELRRGFRGFHFHAEKTGRFVIADGPNGLVDTAFRKFKLTARVIRDRWGERRLPEKIQASLTNGKPDDPYEIIHAIVPRTMSEQRMGAGATAMPWASVWIEKDTKQVIHESGYRVFPAAVPRYQRTPGEVFGRGRGHLAQPDTWTLNTAKRMGFEDWALKLRPPIFVAHDSVIGSLRLVPAGPTSINAHGRSVRDVVMPYDTGSNPQVSQIKEEELRTTIRQIFFIDQILKLMEVSKSEMTAFEFSKKIELLFQLIGSVYGRAEFEFLRRVWDIGFDIMFHAGAFPPPPPTEGDEDGMIDVVFENPIARSQRAVDAQSVSFAAGDLTPLAQVSPGVARALEDRIDADKFVSGVLDIRGVPPKWTRSDEEVAERQKVRQDQEAAQRAMAEAAQIAESAGKAAPMVKVLQEQTA